MANLNPESAAFIPCPNRQSPTYNFRSHPSLSAFTIPFEKHIENRLNTTPPPKIVYRYVATGALVFSTHADPSNDTPNPTNEPRILLLRRSAHDSMPLLWEIPGGAADPEDASILHACARELYEEAGLVASSITAVVDPAGRLFLTRSGNVVCKFEFLVSVQGKGEGEGSEPVPQVKLDPNEHVEYLWATEEECTERRVARGDRAVALVFTDEAQRESVLGGFRLMRDSRPQNSTGKEGNSTL